MQKALERSQFNNKTNNSRQEQFNKCSKRLLKDLEAKGIVRTAVETFNLALHADIKDKTRAECFRTFPTVSFPVASLLTREEIENNKKTCFQTISAVHSRKKKQSFKDPPVDLLYGFRGKAHAVSTLSVYEMMRYWNIAEIKLPTQTLEFSKWTETGIQYKEQCQKTAENPTYIPGIHYKAIESEHRILIPDYKGLSDLRHKWCWEKRSRPHVPLWTNAKMPRGNFTTEENARIISICMRPWTLNTFDVTDYNPLLTDLQKTVLREPKEEQQYTEEDIPIRNNKTKNKKQKQTASTKPAHNKFKTKKKAIG